MADAKYHRDWYNNCSDDYKIRKQEKQTARLDKHKALIVKYLQAHPCVDCGESDIIVLEFDHVRGNKKMAVSDLLRYGFAWAKIEKEIEKCDVRCCNCHRRKTANDFNSYRISR